VAGQIAATPRDPETKYLKLILTNFLTTTEKNIRLAIDSHITALREWASLKTKNIIKIASLPNGEVLVELEDTHCATKFRTAVQRMGGSSCDSISPTYYNMASSVARDSWAWTDKRKRQHGLPRGGKRNMRSESSSVANYVV
jgi:hypothetical protein